MKKVSSYCSKCSTNLSISVLHSNAGMVCFSSRYAKALNGKLFDEIHVETRPEKVPVQSINENANTYRNRKYFAEDEWSSLIEVMHIKKRKCSYYCKVCSHELDGFTIACYGCLEWYHFQCAGLKNNPKRKEWFCRQSHHGIDYP